MPTKVVRTSRSTLGPRGRNAAPRSLIDEALQRNRKWAGKVFDTLPETSRADVDEAMARKPTGS
jgi:hypothetical protein